MRPLALVLPFLAACAGNPVELVDVELTEVVRAHQISAYDGRGLSDCTLALLDKLGLAIDEHDVAIDALAKPVRSITDRERWMARAELLFRRGCRNPKLAADDYLTSACEAARAFGCPGDDDLTVDPIRNRALEAYDYALTRFLQRCIDAAPDLPTLVGRLYTEFELEVDWQASTHWELEDFDRWVCADTLRFTGLRNRHRRPGVGVPLVVQRDGSRGLPPDRSHLTPEAVTRAATVVLFPSKDGDKRGTLRFFDPRTTPRIEVHPGVTVPLAADFTAPFGYLLAQANLHEYENRSFFYATVDDHGGLFLLEDYDPSRQPIVMVHGLWASPLTWRDLTNDVFGDPTLNTRYQVWHYMYATGAPLLENARLLRETLEQARKDLDPEGDDYASQEVLLIGHSMGGLLTRMALLTTGDSIWNTLFDRPFSAIATQLDDQDEKLARRLYFWKPLPYVKRAIFIAAPHRGSDLADSWIGRLGSSLMYAPKKLRKFVDRVRSRTGVQVEIPTSVDELSGLHPVMRSLATLPLAPATAYHSIMGNVSGSQKSEDWTDGIVPYSSSRLDGAASELVIHEADHGVHFDPRASAEVRRILRDALEEQPAAEPGGTP